MTDPCGLCPHDFHGLRCQGVVYPYPTNPYMSGPCPCRGPWAETTEESK